MAELAAPPATAPEKAAVSDEELQEAEKRFKEAVQLVESEPERAVTLLSKVLEVRNKHYGETAIESAGAYYHYGRALFEQARSSTDVLGAKMQNAADKHEAGAAAGSKQEKGKDAAGPSQQQAEPGASAGPEDEQGKTAEGEPAGTGAEGEGSEGDEEGSSSEGEEEGGDEEEDEEPSDMALAWEMLEMARVIYDKHGPDAHASALADVHMSLGDLSTEKEDFELAVEEYQKCLDLLQAMPEPDLRRLAELHFKTIMPLQLSDQVPEALKHCQAAIAKLEKRRSQIVDVMDTPVEGETGEEAEAALEALEKELDDIDAIIPDIREKEDELKQAIKEHASMKAMLVSAMKMMGGAEGAAAAAGQAGAEPSVAGTAGQRGANAPLQALSSAPAAGPAAGGPKEAPAAPASAPVRDLGVAGRGRARITLQPVMPPNGQVGSAPAVGGAGPAGGAAPKRSLEDVLGGGAGSQGVTTVGFGAPGSLGSGAPGSGPDLSKFDAMLAKRMRVEAPAAQAAPAASNKGSSTGTAAKEDEDTENKEAAPQ